MGVLLALMLPPIGCSAESDGDRPLSTEQATPAPALLPPAVKIDIDPVLAADGKRTYESLIARYPQLSSMYARPSLAGGFAEIPTIEFDLPRGAWHGLNSAQRAAVIEYLKSWIPEAQRDPFAFSPLDGNAPIASQIRANARRMTSRHWSISEGDIQRGHVIPDQGVASGLVR